MSTPQTQQMPKETYERAEKYLPWHAKDLVLNTNINPHWSDEFCFQYERKTKKGKEIIKVDTKSKIGTRIGRNN